MGTRRTTGSARTTESPQPAEKGATRRGTQSASATATPASGAAAPRITVSEEARRAMIAQAAYLRAERRGFAPGGDLEDWMAAEAEVVALLRAGNGRPPQ
jgi:hypothetical protein